MNKFIQIDDAILDRVFQPVVNRFGLEPDKTGKSLIIGDGVFALAACMARYAAGTMDAIDAVSTAIVVACAFFVVSMPFTSTRGTASTARIVGRLGRMVTLLAVVTWPLKWIGNTNPVGVDNLLGLFGMLLFYSGWCFMACKTPPPNVPQRQSIFAGAAR